MTVSRETRPKFRLTRPVVPESDIKAGCLQLLTVHTRVAFAWRQNTAAGKIVYPGGRCSQFMKFGFPGCPDILGFLTNGRFLAVECKRVGEKPTLEQQSFLDLVNRHGGLGLVAFSADDVAQALE